MRAIPPLQAGPRRAAKALGAKNVSRHPIRSMLVAAVLAVTATAASACNNNPQLDSTNRGSGSDTTATTVESAYIVPRFLPGRCAIQVGDTAQLKFTITNNRPAQDERLLEITTGAADNVSISQQLPVIIPAKSSIAAGQPATQLDAEAKPRGPMQVSMNGVHESLRPAMSADITFHFSQAGPITVPVPVEACPAPSTPR